MNKILFNKTKIIATVGPACNTHAKLKALVESGVNVFRLNFSHGTHDDHLKVINLVRRINSELGTHVALLQDLQGPKIRMRDIENNGVEIKAGQKFTITTEKMVGNSVMASTTYTRLPKDVEPKDTILIDDGKIELMVTKIEEKKVHTKVIHGGMLRSKKGINLPDSNVSAPSLTKKDRDDLIFGLEHEVEWIALSFVRKAKDIVTLKKYIKDKGADSKVVAKIEKPEAIENIDEIIEVTDALMVARGDLGVETNMEEVPMLQKMIVEKCNQQFRPVIIATQMMESMIENPRPTRAETNDIANAVLDGADTLMLSAETAAGKYPVESVRSMYKTIRSVEKNADIYYRFHELDKDSTTFISDTVVSSAARLCNYNNSKAIIGMTVSGYTAYRLSGYRPKADIFIFTPNERLLNMLSLIWGVRGYYYDNMTSTDQTFRDIETILKHDKHIKKGDLFINIASMPIEERNRTNMLKIKSAD